jgi:hypothetical protein
MLLKYLEFFHFEGEKYDRKVVTERTLFLSFGEMMLMSTMVGIIAVINGFFAECGAVVGNFTIGVMVK